MFNLLFEPIKIRNLELKNRIVMAPMATHFATRDGYVTERLKNYYVERAKGGVGTIVTESCYVHPEGKGGPNRLSICDDETIRGLRGLTSAIHSHDVKAVVQLHHGGRQISPEAICQYPVSASSIPCIGWGVRALPRTLTVREISDLVEAFSDAARRAKDAGYDAIQILAAHGYLLWSFLSPLGNNRTDEYGGDVKNRMRFLLKIIKRSREKAGDIPIMVRINGSDYLNGGITSKDSVAMAKQLEEAGVDAINVSAGTRESHEYQAPPRALPEGCNAHLSAAIKNAVNIPVSIAGRIRSPEVADKILREEKADLIEVGRALLCDPEWPKKVAEERLDDIIPCISCIRCDERLFCNLDIACTVNATVGHEEEYRVNLTEKPKRVLVVGGGPAGLEASRVAALRGHTVSLCEKDAALGGNLRLAVVAHHKNEFRELINYFERQIRKLGVDIQCEQKVTAETIENVKPDVVIVATGSTLSIPPIPGSELENVVTAYAVLAGKANLGKRVIVWGSGLVAAEVADVLSEKGSEVTIVTRRGVRMDMENSNRKILLQRLCEKGVKILINTNVLEVTKDSLIVDRAEKTVAIGMDTFVVSLGTQPDKTLFEELQGKVSELYAVGDCVEPREAFEAISEGYNVALKI